MSITLCGLSTMALMDLAAISTQPWLPMLVGTYTDTTSAGIYSYRFNQETGVAELTATTEATNPSFVIFSKDNANVYAVDESGSDKDAVVAFRYNGIDKPLERLGAIPTEGKAPCNLSTDGRHVFSANYTGGSITEFFIEDGGGFSNMTNRIDFPLIGPAPDKERQQSAHLHCVMLAPDGRHLLACDLGNDCIYTLTVNSITGQLSVVETTHVKAGSGPRHITFDADGNHAYLITELSGDVIVFNYRDGHLTEQQTVRCDNLQGRGSADIHLSPNGRYLYASNRLRCNGLTIFSVDPKSGLMKYAGNQPTGRHPRNFAITPNGRFLLCACRDSDCIQVFAIDQETGMLTDTGQDINLPRPVCVRFQ